MHIGFEDPALAEGPPKEVLAVFRRIRNEIAARAHYESEIRPKLGMMREALAKLDRAANERDSNFRTERPQ